jgi:hypothetical protein
MHIIMEIIRLRRSEESVAIFADLISKSCIRL